MTLTVWAVCVQAVSGTCHHHVRLLGVLTMAYPGPTSRGLCEGRPTQARVKEPALSRASVNRASCHMTGSPTPSRVKDATTRASPFPGFTQSSFLSHDPVPTSLMARSSSSCSRSPDCLEAFIPPILSSKALTIRSQQ